MYLFFCNPKNPTIADPFCPLPLSDLFFLCVLVISVPQTERHPLTRVGGSWPRRTLKKQTFSHFSQTFRVRPNGLQTDPPDRSPPAQPGSPVVTTTWTLNSIRGVLATHKRPSATVDQCPAISGSRRFFYFFDVCFLAEADDRIASRIHDGTQPFL